MNRIRRKHNGSVSLEFVVTLFLILLLFVLLMETLIEAGRANRRQWARQTCLAAAGAQLDSYTALGRPIEPRQIRRLWPNVTVSTEIEPAAGPWQGLSLVRVQARQRIHRREIQIEQSRYILLPGEDRP